jgi:hypothetical protein
VGTYRVSTPVEGLAKRYADPATSGLSVEVKRGSNEVRFDLAAEGIEVGRPVPPLPAYGPDGNVVIEDHLRGKIDPDARFVAVRIPAKELRRDVAKAVGRAP